MKKTICVLVSLTLCIAMVFWGIRIDQENQNGEGIRVDRELVFELHEIQEEVFLVNSAVLGTISGEHTAMEMYNTCKDALGALDRPLPLKLSFYLGNLPRGVYVLEKKIEISRSETFDDVLVYYLDANQSGISIYNLETGMHYYYRVRITLSNGVVKEKMAEFTTADTPRFIYLDGVRNVRDIGGYVNLDGKRIRQGMIFRGTELDAALEKRYLLTEAGAETLMNQLGVVAEIDLRHRATENVQDMLGESVNHTMYGVLAYREILEEEGHEAIRKLFQDLAKPENYPMYIHCSYGIDRTGTICYLIQALCGVSEEDLHTEWELSILFTGSDERIVLLDDFIAGLKTYPGDTIQENVENYLLSIGVTEEEIQEIRNILIEE